MTEDRDIVREWAIIAWGLKKARKDVLAYHGHTDSSYKSLRRDVATHLENCHTDEVPTEYGKVVLTRKPLFLRKKEAGEEFSESITVHLNERE